ncbi:MAG TPA: filamentous hemagglutinin N-terminal domain-containing protein, partial [Gammaproteobacteria bacterium]
MWSFAARSGWGKAMANFSAALLVGILSMQASYAGPEGGRVVRGEGRIVRPDARTTNIQQDSHLLVVDWDSFNVARDETVNFLQPSADAAALNRIFDQDPSEIFGTINANGRVLLVNPNGLLFGRSASVNVGSLIVSGLNIDADDFMAGDWTFENAGSATGGLVINHGLLQAAEGGSVSLFGGAVQNTGAIVADFGTINLAAGKQVTIDFDGDGLIQFAVDGELIENAHGLTSAVSNSGSLQAESGRILMSASAANDVFAQVVNNSGIVSASGVVADGGRVFLTGTGGDVVNTGSITATSQTGKGGEVRVLGDRVGLFDEARVDVSGASGGGTALIGGAYQGGSGVLASSHTVVGSNAVISADAWESGHGGTIIVWADGLTQFFGAISARGGALAGDGGFVEVSGKEFLAYRGNVDTSAANGAMGTLLLDPADIVIAGGTGGADDAEVGDGTVNFADGAAGTFTISEAAIESTDANIILQATNSITVSGTFDNASGNGGDANGVLALMDGRSLSLETSNGAGEGSGGIDLTGSAHGTALVIRTNAGGDITLTAGSNGGDAGTASIAAGSLATGDRGDGNTGDITLDAEGDVSINAAATGSVTAGSSDRTSGFIDITSGGNITAGTLATGGVTVAGNGDSATSGNITLNAAGNVLIGGNVATGAATVNDDGASTGDISITSTGGTITTTSAGMISTGNAAGDDQATNSGAIVLDAFSGMTLDAAVATGNASLNGGSTTATSGGITLSSDSGNIAATGPVTTGDADTDQSAATTGAIGITASNGELQLAGVASGDATVIGGDFDATSGSVTLESTASNVLLNGAIVSGQANSAERNATAGDIDVTAGGAITGNVTGTITTGDASGHGQGGDEFATSGSITMNAANAIAMAAANALATGNATLTTGTGSPAADFATVGDIAITAASISSDGANGALDVSIGSGILMTAEGGVVEGELVAITDGGAGDAGGIFITSGENLRVADIDTDGAVAQNVNISVTGGADLDILAMTTETLSGDAIVFGAETGTLTFSDTAFDVGAGSLVLTGDEIDLAVDAGSISGTGAVTLRASTLANDIRVGDDADSAIATTLDLTDADLAALADGFAGITIGRSDATGTLSIDVDGVLFNDAIALEMSSGNVALEGDVLTAGDTITINATGIELDTAGAIAIDATNGGAVPAGANIAINGAMADATNDSSLTVNAGTGGTLDLDSVTTGLGQSYTASNIDLNGTAYQSTTSGAITFNGTVDLDNGGTIAVQTAGAGGDDITFSSTIDGASTLQLQAGAGGNIDIANGAVGGTTALSALTVTSAGSLAIGTATADGAISLAATSIDGSGGNIVLASNAANIAVNGAVTTNGNDIGITAASGVTTTGSIVTAAAADSGLASGTVGINVTATGDILVANIDTSGADSTIDGTSASDAGAITLATTDGSITTTGAIDASGGNLADGSNATTVDNGGAAAAVSLTTASTGAAADIMLGGTVTARGGTTDNAGGAAGADATITLDAAEDVIGSGGLDIDAGTLALTAGGNGGALTTQVAALSANAETGFNITNTGDLVATLTANNGTAVLGNTGTVTTGGAWTANVFDIDASGAITLDHTVTSDVGGIDIASSADATTVNANVTSAMQALVSGVGVTNSATITGNAGVTINAGAGTFTNTATTGIVQSDGTTDVLVIADDADLQAASSIDAGTGTLTIRAATGGQALNLGTASVAADLDIDNTEIGTVTAGLVQLGDTTVTGAVTADNFDAGALNMRVASSATIDDAGTGVNHITTAGTLDLQAAGAIGGGNTDGLSIDAGSVTAAVSGAGNAISLGAYDADETGANGTPANITVGAGGITTNNGNVILGAADDIMLTGGINAGTGTIALTAHAALDGAAETTASGAINGAGTLTGSAITLRAAGGIGDTIALDTASTNIDADTLAGAVDINNTSAADATVTLASGDSSVTFDQAGAGNLLLDTVNAATTATLSSAAAINDSAADTTTDVTATAVSLTAGTGIGASGDVDLAAASIGAASTTGAIDINNAATAATTVTNLATDGANISFTQAGGQTLDVQQAATTTSGDISISNDSAALTAGSGAGITSAGNVTLATTTSGDIVLSDVSGTTVSVNSAGNINDGAAVAATVAAASLELIAASGIADLDIDADTLAATTASGDLTVTDSDALEIGSVGGTSGIAITGGTANNIVITAGGALTTTGAATDEISNQFGDISLAGASIGTLATPLRVSLDAAGVLNLDSGASIFVTSPSSLSLGAVSTGAGADDVSIGISATTATLDLTQALDAGTDADLSGDNLAFAIAGTTLPTAPANDSTFDNNGFAIDVDGGSLSITADTINLAGTVEATGGISISAADEGSTIGLGNAGSAAVAGQNFVLTNATLLTLLGASGGSLIVGDASSGNVIMDGVDISTITNGTLTVVTGGTIADDDLVAGHGFVGGGDDSLVLTSDGIIDNLSVNAGTIDVISSGGNDVSLDIFSDLANVEVSARTGGAGNVDITQNNDVLATFSNMRVGDIDTTGTVTLTNNAGSISESSIADAGVDIAGSSISLTASGGIGAGFPLELASANISADANGGAVLLNNDATGLGSVTVSNLSATTNVNFTQAGGEDLVITAASGATGVSVSNDGGNLTATSITVSDVNSDISLQTLNSGDILLGSVTAPNAVFVNSAGAIEESGADATAEIATASVNLDAVSGIGNAAALELAVSGLIDATNSGTGNIALVNDGAGGAYSSAELYNENGNISFTDTGNHALIVSAVTNASGDIALASGTGFDLGLVDVDSAGAVDATAGAQLVFEQAAAGSDMTLTAASGISELDLPGGGLVDDGVADLVADTVSLQVTGDGNIGIAGDPSRAVEIDAVNVSAQVDGTAGQINIENFRGDTAATTVTNLSLAGAGDIEYAQTGGANVTFQGVSTTDGNITLANDGANLVADSVTAASVVNPGDVTLATTTGGTISVGSITAAGTVSISSAADVIESTNATTTDITASSVAINAQTGVGTTANGAIDINAATIGATTAAGGIDLHAAGPVSVTFSNVDANAGNVRLTVDGGNLLAGIVTADAGDVRLETVTSGDIALGSITASADATAISAGAINENANDGTADITAATATLSAQSGIGADANGSLDISIATVDSASTVTGGINLATLGATTFSSVTTTGVASDIDIDGTGNTTVTAASTTDGSIGFGITSGNLVAGTITAGGAGQGVFLGTATNGDITLGDVTATDAVIIDSAGRINDDAGGADTDADATGASVSLSAVNGMGDTDRVEVDAPSLSASNTTTGDVVLGVLGDVTLSGAISNSATGGGLDLTAIDGHLDTGTGLLSTQGGDITLTATDNGSGGNLVVGTGGIDTNGAALVALNAADNIVLNGNVTSAGGTIDANAGDNALEAVADSTGSINGAGVLAAAGIDLAAATGIGNGGTLNVDADVLVANVSATGAIDIADSDSVQLGDAGAGIGAADGDITITAAGLITSGNSIDAGAANVVDISTTTGRITLSHAVSSQGGDIVIASGNGTLTTTGVTTTGTGAITLTANDNGSAAAVLVNGTVGTGSGGIVIAAADTVSIGASVTTTGNVSVTADDGTRDAAAENIGSISGGGLVSGNQVSLAAAQGVSANTAATTLSVTNTSSGAVAVTEADDVTFATNMSNQAAGEALSVTTLDGAIDTGTAAVSTSDGTITLVAGDAGANDGSITVGSGGIDSGSVNAGDVSLAAADGVTLTGSVNASGTTTSGNVAIEADSDSDSAGAINGAGLVTASMVDLDAGSGIGNMAALELVAAVVTADTTNGAIDIDNTLATAVAVNSLTTDAGTITFDQSGGGAVTFDTVTTTTAGAIDLENTAGDLAVGTAVTANGASNVTLTANGGITLTGTTSAAGAQAIIDATGAINGAGLVTADVVDLDAGSGIGNTTALELAASTVTADTATGAIDIDNALATAVSVSSLTTDTGTITFDQSGGGDVTFDTVTTTTSGTIDLENTAGGLVIGTAVTANGASNVTLTANGAITLTGTTSAAGAQATIDATGAINGAGLVTASTVDLDAGSGIGNTTQLELAASTITADTATGAIDIDNALATAVSVSSLTTDSGAITFDQSGGGAVTFGNVTTTTSGAIDLENAAGNLVIGTAATANGASNVTLTTGGAGNVILTGTTNAAGDQVTISSAGSISGPGLVTAAIVDLGAVAGISANTATDTLTVDNTTSGDVNIVETDDVTLATRFRNLAAGAQLTLISNDGDIDTSTAAVSSNDGFIGIAALDASDTGATLTIGSGGLDSGSTNAGDITLYGADGIALGGNVDASGGTTSGDVTMNANFGDGTTDVVGAITRTAGTVSGNALSLSAASGIDVNIASATLAVDNTGSGNVSVTEADGVTFATAVRNQALNGTLSVTTTDGAIDTSTAAVSTNDGALTLAAGDAGANNGGITIGTGGVDSGSANAGDVFLDAADGVTLTGNIDASGTTTSGDIAIEADDDGDNAGAIAGGGTLTAQALAVNAATGIGTTGAGRINVSAADIDATNTTAGGIFIANASGADVTFGTVDAQAAGDIELFADGDMHLGAVSGTASVHVESTAGSVLDAQDDESMVADVSGSDITLVATGDIGGIDPVTPGVDPEGELEVNASASLALNAQDVFVDDVGGNSVTLDFDGANFSYSSSGDILVGLIDATGTVSLATDGGSINDATVDAVTDILGTTVTLTARDEIGGGASALGVGDTRGAIEISSSSLDASVTTAGDIVLHDTGGTTLADIDTVSGAIDIDSDSALVAADVRTLGGTAADDITLAAASLQLGTVDAGAAGMLLATANAIDVTGGVTAADATMDANGGAGDITDNGGHLVVSGTTTLLAQATDSIVLDDANNDFNTVIVDDGVAGADAAAVTIVDTNDVNLGAATIAGHYDVTADAVDVTGTVTTGSLDVDVSAGTGDIVDSTGMLTIAGASTFTVASGSDVLLDAAANDFDSNDTGDAVSVAGTAGTVTLADEDAIVLGDITATTLNVTASGAITDDGTGNLVIGDTATFAAGAGNDIALDVGTNDFDTVVVTSGNNVTFADANGILLDDANVAGTYDVTADAIDVTGTVAANALDFDVSGGTGDIIDSTGTLTIAGASTFTVASGSDVLLDAAANDFDSNDTGDAVSVAGTAGIVTLADEDAIVLGDITATTLNVTASGAITDDGTGNLVIGDTATFAAGAGNDIALDVGTNDFDTVVVTSGNNVTFADANG